MCKQGNATFLTEGLNMVIMIVILFVKLEEFTVKAGPLVHC